MDIYLKRISKRPFIVALILSAFFACTSERAEPSNQELVIQGAAQGTTYTVKYIGEKYDFLPSRIDSLLLSIDHSLSTYDTTSLITAFNRGDTIVPDILFKEMVNFSKQISEETNGAFDPTIGPLIKAWGWGFSNAEDMDSLKVQSLLELKGFDKIHLSDLAYIKKFGSKLNFNAIAQGYSVDLMADLLEDMEIYNYYVELGGEIKVKGKNGRGAYWRIGIDKPEEGNDDRQMVASVVLENSSMATSGNYRKYYEKDGKKYAHTIDPSTGFPVEHNLLSATVISKDCYRADALATAFMVMGIEKAKRFLEQNPKDLAYLIYSQKDGSYAYYTSEGLEEKLENLEEKD